MPNGESVKMPVANWPIAGLIFKVKSVERVPGGKRGVTRRADHRLFPYLGLAFAAGLHRLPSAEPPFPASDSPGPAGVETVCAGVAGLPGGGL